VRYDAAWHRRLREIIAELPFRSQVERVAMRRALAADPVAFAVIYLSHHLKDSSGSVTFSEVHYEWARIAESWRGVSEPQESRHAFIAPRETGKSTWWFLILPLWAAANSVRRFAVAFAHADSQATGHLSTFKRELDTNPLLRADFPELCEPARKPSSGTTLADRQGMLHTSSGFVFAARGVDTASLGLKVGEVRPDLLVFDDIEPDEAQYSPKLAEKRLGTITDALFPLNIRAAVVMVGTVTMPGSIMHQLVRVAHGSEEPELKWIRDEKIVPHHHEPILSDESGEERSMWPEKWPLDWLLSIRHTRSFAKNYLNDPMGRDGDYWTMEDFRYATVGAEATRWILQLDPAVTSKDKSDFTGWAIVAYRPPMTVERTIDGTIPVRVPTKPVAEVVASGKVRLIGEALRAWVLKKLTEYERIKAVRVEVNQGGELWYTVLHTLPVKLIVHTSNESKEVRFAFALDLYQRGHVIHRERMRELEEQMVAFPKAPFDDIADAAVCGVLFFLSDLPKVRTTVETRSYINAR
jgi:phage terminase large subunit-like protein